MNHCSQTNRPNARETLTRTIAPNRVAHTPKNEMGLNFRNSKAHRAMAGMVLTINQPSTILFLGSWFAKDLDVFRSVIIFFLEIKRFFIIILTQFIEI